jgi:hypothetical protein
VDVSAVLTSAFGSGWADDPEIYAGLAGVWGSSNSSNVLQNQDPHRTIYASSPRTSVGTVGQPGSLLWDVTEAGNGALTGASNNIISQNNVLENSYTTKAAVSPSGVTKIPENNPFISVPLGIQGLAFNLFQSGVQQRGSETSFGTFGAAGSVEFALDLNRILGKNNVAGQVGGTLSVGSFEGTVTVGTDGQVSFITQGSGGTPFQTWALTFPALDTEAKRLPDADPDFDGLNNLMEFVLNGNPGVSDNAAINPALDASGENFIFNFSRRDDSVAGSTLVFQHGSDLSGWTDVAIGASSNLPTVEVQQGTPADAITVTIPKSPGGTLFGRLKVTQP